jgi:hypothetical protein
MYFFGQDRPNCFFSKMMALGSSLDEPWLIHQFLAILLLGLTLVFFALVTAGLGFSGFSSKLSCLAAGFSFSNSASFFFAWLFMDSGALVDGFGLGSSFAVIIFLTQSLISLLRTTTFPAKVPANLDTVSTVPKSSDLWLSIIGAFLLRPEIFF